VMQVASLFVQVAKESGIIHTKDQLACLQVTGELLDNA
jgi:hypothetical protein